MRPRLLTPNRIALLLTLIGFALRAQHLSLQPLWGDEGWSFYLAIQPTPELIALTAADIHPPLYYLLLKAWLTLAGIGPEAGRVLSLVVGTLLIPAIYVLGRRLFSMQVGVLAAALTSVMPMAVYYSQEVRMYGLVTLLGVLAVYFYARGSRWPFIAVMTAALYTHYYAVLILAAVGLLTLVELIQHRREAWARLWPFGAIGLLYLPWVIFLGSGLLTYVENKRTLDADAPLDLLTFLNDHLSAFSLGHLTDGLPFYAALLIVFAIADTLGLVALFNENRRENRLLLLYLLVPIAGGFVINRLFPFNPSFYERTLLIAAPADWLLLSVGLAWLWQRQKRAAQTLTLLLAISLGVGLTVYYAVPRYTDADYRPLLAEIDARATEEDTLIASYQWQVGYYHAYLSAPRPQIFTVPGWGQGWGDAATGRAQMEADLAQILAQSERVWFPAHQLLGHIWEDQAEAALIDLSYPALREWPNAETKLTLVAAPPPALVAGPSANFGDQLLLAESAIGPGPFEAGRDIVPMALVWQRLGPLEGNLRITFRLADGEGRTWTIRDAQPKLGETSFGALALGESLLDQQGLQLPAGMPPGDYRLLVSLRRVTDASPLDLLDAAGQPYGAELQLATVQVIDPAPPVGAAALPIQTRVGIPLAEGVTLLGYSLGEGPFQAGQALPLTLFWQATTDQPTAQTITVNLFDDVSNTVIAAMEQPPLRPFATLEADDLLRDPQDFTLPPMLTPGFYDLTVSLGTTQINLGQIRTTDRPRIFEPPTPDIDLAVTFNEQARLIGVDLPTQRVQPGDVLPVTLHWQALATFERNWTVFVHLVDGEGNLITQKDQIPGGGEFPTTSWLPDEYLRDEHPLAIPPDAAPQTAFLSIGLYDANDPAFIRLPITGGGDGNHVVLENWPISVE